MADEFGGAGSDFPASTPQTNTISTSQPNVDSVESSQSVSNAPINTNTSVNAENRSERPQTRESDNQQIIAAAKNSEGTQGYVLVKGEDGKTHLKPSPLPEQPKNEGTAQEPNTFDTDGNQPKLTDAPQQIGQQFNQQLPAYTLDEFSNAIATGHVDEKRVPQEYQRQYADWKINQAVQAHNAQQKAIAQQEAARRAEIEAQMNPETRQEQMREFLTGLDKEADARARQDAGLSEEDIENLDLMDDDDPKLINYKLAKEWHRQDLMAKMQNRYADEQAQRQRQEAVYAGINQFTEEQRAKEPNFDAIDRMLLTRVNDLTYKQAQVIVPVLQALQNGTINEAQTEILRNYYEDTRKMFYMQKNGLDTTPKAVNRPPTVERAGDGRDIKSVYVPDYSALAKSDVRGRRAWLAEFIRNRNQ
jgi:hypothetical protein|nr:MAG TPA: hypothetical protein [Caudoviricetes sp.]